ncbi:transposase [Nocardia sp. BMG111209]|uniref:transposase n=1 Tax=Nocardia sp. BMG111209 TaxID=1160137 RepID=UPI000372FD77|nr:transposase [Nocardia sp. BMG111209]
MGAPPADVHFETLRIWIEKALADRTWPGKPVASGLSPAERDELQKLRREIRDLKQANEILEPASAFFARELDGRHR